MKKYFLMLATMTAALFVSCKPTDTPPPPIDESKVILSESVYYGEKLGSNYGYYSMTFTKGDDKLRLDILSSVAPDPDKAKPLAGTYELGTLEEPTSKTYFLAENSTATEGTIYWANGTPVMVTGGQVIVQTGAGNGFAVTLKLQAGENNTIEWKYNGTATFINKYEAAPRKPIKSDQYLFSYLGEYSLSSTRMGLLGISLSSESEPDKVLMLQLTIPYPEETDKVEIPAGTFQVVKDPQEPYQIAAGYMESRLFQYSQERHFQSDFSAVKQVVTIEEGSMTITKEGNVVALQGEFSGTLMTLSGGFISKQSDIVYIVEPVELPQYAEDSTVAKSTITEDKTLENYTNVYNDGWTIVEDNSKAVYRFVFSTEDLIVTEANDYSNGSLTLNIMGEGELMCIQYVCDPKNPTGTFPMDSGFQTLAMNRVIPGMRGLGDMLTFQHAGTSYAEVKTVDGRPTVVNQAGTVPGKGSITVSQEDNMVSIDVEVYDRYDHKISGTLSFQVTAEQYQNAVKYVDVPPMATSASVFSPYAPIQLQ